MESKITYGLRHLPTGRFARLDIMPNRDDDFCNPETVRLTVRDAWLSDRRYEVERLLDLAKTMRHDIDWIHSSRENPQWGDVKIEDCVPVAFVVETEHDALGGDPVSFSEKSYPVHLPQFHAGNLYGSRPVKDDFHRIFEDAVPEDMDTEWAFTALVNLAEADLQVGMLAESPVLGIAQVVTAVPVPPRWPIDAAYPFSRSNPDIRLALFRKDNLWSPELSRTFIGFEDTFDPPTALSPRPA